MDRSIIGGVMNEQNNLACWPEHLDCDHRDYIGRACTLHGKPAKICKNEEGYALVCPLNPELGSVPFSWCAVWNIIDNHGGEFGEL